MVGGELRTVGFYTNMAEICMYGRHSERCYIFHPPACYWFVISHVLRTLQPTTVTPAVRVWRLGLMNLERSDLVTYRCDFRSCKGESWLELLASWQQVRSGLPCVAQCGVLLSIHQACIHIKTSCMYVCMYVRTYICMTHLFLLQQFVVFQWVLGEGADPFHCELELCCRAEKNGHSLQSPLAL